jgi:hypothetical protein
MYASFIGSIFNSWDSNEIHNTVCNTGLRIRIDLMRIRIPDSDPGFDDLKMKEFTAGNFYFYFLD